MGNATNLECTTHSLPESQIVAISSLIFYAGLGVLGLVGNVNVILVFATSREQSLRFLVIVLSCLDLAICAIILPTDCYRVFTDYLARSASSSNATWVRPVNHWLSSLILSSRYAAFEMEAWVLVLIALDRYLCIVRARRCGLPLQRTLAALGVVGAFLLLLESGNIIGHYLIENQCNLKLLVESNLFSLYGAMGTISVIIVAVLYARIFTFVAGLERRKSTRRAQTELTLKTMTRPVESAEAGAGGGFGEASEAMRDLQALPYEGEARSWFPKKLALMLFAASLLFYISMLPTVLINFKLLPDSPLHRFFYVNAALNCFVYAMVNEKFRMELKTLYCKRALCGSHQPE